jgi:hypothetical protein
MSAHTPGPWSATEDGNVIQDSDGALIAIIPEDPAGKRDGRLIAAAPEMLEALKAMTHGLPDLLDSIGYADEEGMVEKALAAIAKAEGAS